MKLRTYIIAGALAAAPLAASAAVVDSFQINSADPNGIDSTLSFLAGTEYTIEVSGTFVIDSSSGRLGDADYFDFQPGSTVRDTTGGGTIDIGVAINDMPTDWGPYTDTHVYSITTAALSGIVNFKIVDSGFLAYSDNIGSLDVSISTADTAAVPLPAGLPLLLVGLSGLALLRRKAG